MLRRRDGARDPVWLLAAFAPERRVLFARAHPRRPGGGHGLPDDARADHRALVRDRAHALDRAVVGHRRGDRRRSARSFSGVLLEHYWWGSVFLLTLPLAVVALVLALRLVPGHVNEGDEPVDNLGGVLSLVLVGALVLAINFAPVPNKTARSRSCWPGSRSLALVLFFLRQRRARNPLYDLDVAAPARVLGRRVRGDHRVRLADGRDVHRPAVPAERARLLDAGCGPVDPAGGGLHGAGRAPLGEAGRGARGALHAAASATCSAARLPHDAAAVEGGHRLLEGRPRLRLHRHRRRLRRYARLALADGLGAGHGAPAWPRARPICNATSAGRSCSRSSARC